MSTDPELSERQTTYAAAMLPHYVLAMLWANTYGEEDGEPVESAVGDFDADDLPPAYFAELAADLLTLVEACWDDLLAAEQCPTTVANGRTGPGAYGPEQAGHDYALTRNGHGVGFWDRGLGDIGERLSAYAHAAGEVSWFVTADGELLPE